ncbi:hypothetical protein GCM10027411_07400 [Microbacterium aureliae]
MARVERIEPGDLASRVHPTRVVCSAQLVDDGEGSYLVQLASFGSTDSVSNGKRHVTQTYQFDRETARELVHYFVRAFGDEVFRSKR